MVGAPRERHLLLLRHAQACTAGPGEPDRQRPLSEHGRAQAQQLAQRLAAAGFRPDAIWCSPAVRTRETAALLAARLGGAGAMLVDPALYGADAAALLSRLQRCDASVGSLVLVGHNPGISALAHSLTASGVVAPLELPPCGLARLQVAADSWAALAPAAVTAVAWL